MRRGTNRTSRFTVTAEVCYKTQHGCSNCPHNSDTSANLIGENTLDTSCIMHMLVVIGAKMNMMSSAHVRISRRLQEEKVEMVVLEGRGESALLEKELVGVYSRMIHGLFLRIRLVDDE